MVCDECQSKLKKVIVPDKWKAGATNHVGPVKAGKTNKALEAKKASAQWLPQESKCRICRSKIQHQMNYCNDCAYQRGICSMCGKKAVDVSSYRMSNIKKHIVSSSNDEDEESTNNTDKSNPQIEKKK